MSGTLSNQQIKDVTNKLLDENHLFYGINEQSTKVYTRTFSVLMLAPIIYKHRKDKLFTAEELIEVFNKVVDYFVRENDLHGYSDEYGWAHSVAHTADVFDELTLCDELDKTHLDILLNVIKNKVAQSDYLYRHGEDDRLVTAINSLLSRGLHTNAEIIEWINSFKEKTNEETFIKNFAIKTNTKNLIRSLYFTLIKQEKFQEVCKAIENY
jgi:hypothetical protein